MKRVLTTLVLAIGMLLAACGGAGTSPGTTLEPFSPDTSPATSPESSPDTTSPEASPS